MSRTLGYKKTASIVTDDRYEKIFDKDERFSKSDSSFRLDLPNQKGHSEKKRLSRSMKSLISEKQEESYWKFDLAKCCECIYDHIQNSSLGIFHKTNCIRKVCILLVESSESLLKIQQLEEQESAAVSNRQEEEEVVRLVGNGAKDRGGRARRRLRFVRVFAAHRERNWESLSGAEGAMCSSTPWPDAAAERSATEPRREGRGLKSGRTTCVRASAVLSMSFFE